MFKLNFAEETKKAESSAQAAVNSAGQAAQQVLDQVTEAGQKAIDNTCRSAQETGEKAMQNVTSQITAWGNNFAGSEEKKNTSN